MWGDERGKRGYEERIAFKNDFGGHIGQLIVGTTQMSRNENSKEGLKTSYKKDMVMMK